MTVQIPVLVCCKCGKSFPKSKNGARRLRRHERVHLGSQPLQCQTCNKKFFDKRHFQNHINAHNPDFDTSGYPCSFCDKKFYSKSNMERHSKICPKNKENWKIYQCQECDKGFKSAQYLKEHVRIVHEKVKAHECQTCKSKFLTRQTPEKS